MLWDVGSGQRLHTLDHAHNVDCVVFSSDGATLATGSWDGTMILWDVQSGQRSRTLELDMRGLKSLAFSPDGAILGASGWDDGTVRIWAEER
jgi:WD40 repeat protein